MSFCSHIFHQIVRFLNEIVAYRELFCVVLNTSVSELEQPRRPRRKRENTNKKVRSVRKTKTLNAQHPFWQISLPFRTNEAVELDRNGKMIAVWSIAIVLIPSEIIKQSLSFLPTYNFIRHREVATKSNKYSICIKKFYLIFNDKYSISEK